MKSSLIPLLLAAVVVVGLPDHVPARQHLTESELEQTGAAGVQVFILDEFSGSQPFSTTIQTIAGGSPYKLTNPLSPLVLNNVVGENEVITRLTIAVSGAGLALPGQEIRVAQRRDSADGESVEPTKKDLRAFETDLLLRDAAVKDLMAAVVNNVFGANRVDTIINVLVQGSNQVGSGFNSLGGAPATPGSNPSPSENTVSAVASPAPTPTLPTTIQGGITFLEALAPKVPEVMPDLMELRRIDQSMTRYQSRFSVPTPASRPTK